MGYKFIVYYVHHFLRKYVCTYIKYMKRNIEDFLNYIYAHIHIIYKLFNKFLYTEFYTSKAYFSIYLSNIIPYPKFNKFLA